MNTFVTSPPKKRIGPSSPISGSFTPQLLSTFEAGPSASKKRLLDFPNDLKASISKNDDFWSSIFADEPIAPSFMDSFFENEATTVDSFSPSNQDVMDSFSGVTYAPSNQDVMDSFSVANAPSFVLNQAIIDSFSVNVAVTNASFFVPVNQAVMGSFSVTSAPPFMLLPNMDSFFGNEAVINAPSNQAVMDINEAVINASSNQGDMDSFSGNEAVTNAPSNQGDMDFNEAVTSASSNQAVMDSFSGNEAVINASSNQGDMDFNEAVTNASSNQGDMDSFSGNVLMFPPVNDQDEMDCWSSILVNDPEPPVFLPLIEAGQPSFYSFRRAPKGVYLPFTVGGNQTNIGQVMGFELTALANYYIWLPAPENFLFSGPFTIEVIPKNTTEKVAEIQVLHGEFQNEVRSQQHPLVGEWGVFVPILLHLENDAKYFHLPKCSSDPQQRGATNAVIAITHSLWVWKKDFRMKPKVAKKSGKRARTEMSRAQ